MEDKVYKELTISQFAKFCGTTRQTLQYYDKVGILRPSLIGEQGYRYYEHMQTYDFRLINALKNIGCTLEEIKAFFSCNDAAVVHKTLSLKRQEIDAEISKLQLSRRIIDNTELFMNIIEQFGYTPKIVDIAAHLDLGLYTFTQLAALESDEYKLELQRFSEFSKNIPSLQLHPCGFIIPQDEFISGERRFSHIVFIDYTDFSMSDRYHLPANKYLIVKADMVYPYDKTREKAYSELNKYMEENHMVICGDAYEVPAKALITLQASMNMPILIMVPIKKISI
jgi:DNA-binding transcriptional MerR regulator